MKSTAMFSRCSSSSLSLWVRAMFTGLVVFVATHPLGLASAQYIRPTYVYSSTSTTTSTTTTTTPSPSLSKQEYYQRNERNGERPAASLRTNKHVDSPHFDKMVASGSLYSRSGFGLPAYKGPEGSQSRGNGPADYMANSAGFVLSDLQSDASSNRLYDMAMAGNKYSNTKARLGAVATKRSRSDYGALLDSVRDNEADLASYLKAAASESSSHTETPSHGNSAQWPQRTVTLRRKPNYAQRVVEEQHIFDPNVAKHFLKSHVVRETDLGSNGLMDSSGEQAAASSDNELAQLAATMSELQSNPTSSPDFMSLAQQFGSGSGLSMDQSYSDFSGLGSMGAQSLQSQASAPSSVPGVPPGAIVGAPGSAPPPGMKLAGYVTMAGPQPQMGPMNPMGMGSAMMNPMMMRNPMAHAMAQSMSQGMRLPMPGMNPMGAMGQMGSGPMRGPQGMGPLPGMGGAPGMAGMAGMMSAMGGPGGLSPALQQLIGSTFGGGGMPKLPGAAGMTAEGSQAQASQAAPQRTFLSRLNPLNLFRRLRTRKAEKSMNEKRSMMVAESSRRPVFFLKRMDEGPVEFVSSSVNDTQTAENNQYPVAGMYGSSYGRPSFRPQSGLVRFPSRRGRRIQSGRIPYFGSESRPLAMMGSGNFEVIRGGVFPGSQHPEATAASEGTGNRNVESSDNDYEEGSDRGVLSTLEDDFFSAGSPGILGFQGFNHFSGASIYNSLSASDPKSTQVLSPTNKTTDKFPAKKAVEGSVASVSESQPNSSSISSSSVNSEANP